MRGSGDAGRRRRAPLELVEGVAALVVAADEGEQSPHALAGQGLEVAECRGGLLQHLPPLGLGHALGGHEDAQRVLLLHHVDHGAELAGSGHVAAADAGAQVSVAVQRSVLCEDEETARRPRVLHARGKRDLGAGGRWVSGEQWRGGLGARTLKMSSPDTHSDRPCGSSPRSEDEDASRVSTVAPPWVSGGREDQGRRGRTLEEVVDVRGRRGPVTRAQDKGN